MGSASIDGTRKVPTESPFESKRMKSRDAGERVHDGDISPLPFHEGANGAAVLFLKMSLVISWFSKFELKRILIAAIRAQET